MGQFSLETKDDDGKTLSDLYSEKYVSGRILYPVLDEITRVRVIEDYRPISQKLKTTIIFKAIAMQHNRPK